jgi:hypothetical protein
MQSAGTLLSCGDTPDAVEVTLGEPQRTIRPRCEAARLTVRSWERALLHLTRYGDAADLVAKILREPQGAVRTQCDLC